MALKNIWKDKVDNVDDVVAKDINNIAQAVIELEDDTKEIGENIPTKVSQLENDAEYARSSEVKTAIEEASAEMLEEAGKKDTDVLNSAKKYTDERTDSCADVINLTTDIDKSHTITDSSNKKITGLSVFGESESVENPALVITGKNLLDINNYKIINGVIAFDVSNLEIGKKYRFSSNSTIYAFKISTTRDGYNSVSNYGNPIKNLLFTMARNANIPESATQYLFLSVNEDTSWVTDITQLDGYTLQIENGTTTTEFEEYTEVQKVVIPYTFAEGDNLTLSDGAVKTNIGGAETNITDTDTGKALLALHTNYPTTVITCDADCEVTYKADTTNVFENIKNNGGGGDISNAILDAIIAEQESIIAIQNALIGGDVE